MKVKDSKAVDAGEKASAGACVVLIPALSSPPQATNRQKKASIKQRTNMAFPCKAITKAFS